MDMNKAVSSLERAIETLKSSGDSTAFVQVQSLVRTGLLMADALGLGKKSNKKVITALLSQPDEPESDYELAMQAKLDVLKQAQLSLENAQKDRAKTTEAIATANEDLTATNAQLNDDRVYLKDLTAKCETKAKEWDQRSAMRADELAALTQALAVLESTVA